MKNGGAVTRLLRFDRSSSLPLFMGKGFQCSYSTEDVASNGGKAGRRVGSSLFKRLSPAGGLVSIGPLLDQWLSEGRDGVADKQELIYSIKELRHFRRFRHALEVSQWMSDKRCFVPSVQDIAVRLDLLSRVYGIDQAENYFDSIPENLRTLEVHGALLSCYYHAKSVDKAETVMQKLRDLGLTTHALSYNVMLKLYCRAGDHEKLHTLLNEMEEKGIRPDKYTYCIMFNAPGANSNIDGLNKIMEKIESDSEVDVDHVVYATAGNAYMRAGHVEDALRLLRKSEALVRFTRRKSEALNYLLTQYAAAGKREDVWRIWLWYKKRKVLNKGYMSMISSLLKLNDLEGAEQIFKEWESSGCNYDIRVANSLINAYCKNGLVEKAEAVMNRAKERQGKPNSYSWFFLSSGYLQRNEKKKATEAMKAAILACQPGWKPHKATLASCVQYLKEEVGGDEYVEFIRLLSEKSLSSDMNTLEDGISGGARDLAASRKELTGLQGAGD